jgi:hypothetical protein
VTDQEAIDLVTATRRQHETNVRSDGAEGSDDGGGSKNDIDVGSIIGGGNSCLRGLEGTRSQLTDAELAERCSAALAELAVARGSKDDISVVVVDLTLHFENKLDNRIAGVCESLNEEQSIACLNDKVSGRETMETESDTEACTPQKGMVPTRTIAPKNTRGHVRTPLVSPPARFISSPDSVHDTDT